MNLAIADSTGSSFIGKSERTRLPLNHERRLLHLVVDIFFASAFFVDHASCPRRRVVYCFDEDNDTVEVAVGATAAAAALLVAAAAVFLSPGPPPGEFLGELSRVLFRESSRMKSHLLVKYRLRSF